VSSRPTHADVSEIHPAADPAQVEAELASEKEEVLRLRDLLIARDAELGVALGRLAAIEQGSQRIGELAERIPIPGAGRLLFYTTRLLQRALR
jgi:hypothetical protein